MKMSLFEQGELALTLRHYSRCKASFSEIDKLCHEAFSILSKNNPGSEDLARGLSKTGQMLWNNLLTSQVKERLKASRSQNLEILIDEELINIPWELLYDGNNFLCLNFNLGRLVRSSTENSPVQYRSFSSILKMLVLANPTNDLKSSYLEGVNIKNQLDKKRDVVHIDFKSSRIDKHYVKKNLCDYDIVHFAGHCEYDSFEPKNSGWVLSEDKFSVEDVLSLGQAASLPSLVFSNGCFTADSPYTADYKEKNYSFARAFLSSGVRHFIGTMRKIQDPVSFQFSKEFYAQLISGKPIGECVRLSRLSLMKEHGIGSLHWASYLLYGDPNFVLFKAKQKKVVRDKKIRFTSLKKYFIKSLIPLAIALIAVFLYMWLPSRNPTAYILFLKAKNSFQNGQNQQVISFCNQAIQKDSAFLLPIPLLADTYQRMGQKDLALKYYFEYALLSEKKLDKRHLADAYIKIGWLHHLYAEYDKAFDFYNKAVSLAIANNDKLNEALGLRKLAVWYIDKKDYALALELLTKSSEINRRNQNIYEYKYNLACDYFDIGLVFVNKDDYASAKDFYDKSRQIFEKLKAKSELSDYYFNLGETALFDKQYRKSLDYYSLGLKSDRQEGNKINLPSDYNMIGELHMEMGDDLDAENSFNTALEAAKNIDLKPEIAAASYNLGLLYKKQGRRNKTREFLRQAQEIYSQIDPAGYEEVKKELASLP